MPDVSLWFLYSDYNASCGPNITGKIGGHVIQAVQKYPVYDKQHMKYLDKEYKQTLSENIIGGNRIPGKALCLVCKLHLIHIAFRLCPNLAG